MSTQSNEERLLLNSRQAAKALGISERKLWELKEANEVPHVLIGRRCLFPKAALESWITSRTEGAST